MTARFLPAFAALSLTAAAAPPKTPKIPKSGHATAEWISGSDVLEAGKPLLTGIRLKIDEGWHTYWTNPGEAGSKLKVVWSLPPGWTASDISHPYPKGFLTGELPGYGYEGEVIFPVTLNAPESINGPLEMTATISWLTCNDDACVPGKVDTTLSLAVEGATEAITAAEAKVPKPLAGTKLVVRESEEGLDLTLTLPPKSKINPANYEVFPATEQAVDHSKPIRFEKSGPTWSAKAGKNEYADGPLKALKLVLVKEGAPPIEVSWSAE